MSGEVCGLECSKRGWSGACRPFPLDLVIHSNKGLSFCLLMASLKDCSPHDLVLRKDRVFHSTIGIKAFRHLGILNLFIQSQELDTKG